MWSWFRALWCSESPELKIIIRHGKAMLGVLAVEGVVEGVLQLLKFLAIIGSQLKGIIEPILLWTAVANVCIFCITAVAIAALDAFDEIRRRYRQVRRGEVGEV